MSHPALNLDEFVLPKMLPCRGMRYPVHSYLDLFYCVAGHPLVTSNDLDLSKEL